MGMVVIPVDMILIGGRRSRYGRVRFEKGVVLTKVVVQDEHDDSCCIRAVDGLLDAEMEWGYAAVLPGPRSTGTIAGDVLAGERPA
jgi:hypothetical protein